VTGDPAMPYSDSISNLGVRLVRVTRSDRT